MRALIRRGRDIAKSAVGFVKGHKPRSHQVAVKTPIKMEIGNEFNYDWDKSDRGMRFTFVPEPLIRKTDRIFTIGSCFAVEVKMALEGLGFDAYPKYRDIAFDPATQHLAKLPAVDDLNHYNTYSIRAEFERAFSGEHYELGDFIRQPAPWRRGIGKRDDIVWRDPYRRHAYATNEGAILDLSRKIDECFREGVMASDVYVITLGLTEAWRSEVNGRFLNQAPYEINNSFSFHCTTYPENYENIKAVCQLLTTRFPHKKIVLTVSPVSFKRTFSSKDVLVANMESKSVLRAVAGAIEREFDNVTYWPSYELATIGNLFDDRGREVAREGVKQIIQQFAKVHVN